MAGNVQGLLTKIDTAHAEDPNKHTQPDGSSMPYELHYAQKSSYYLSEYYPPSASTQPSPELTIAVRAQHFRRWEVPRDSYPRTKPGYFAWRAFLKKRQAEQVKALCLETGFNEESSDRIAALVRKEGLKKGEGNGDEEVQVLEDVACLVFLDDQFEQFKESHDEGKIVDILRKTWAKMGERGKEMALTMDLGVGEEGMRLIKIALGETG